MSFTASNVPSLNQLLAPKDILEQQQRDLEFARRTLARDDASRAGAPKIKVVAIAAFTMVEDDENGEPVDRVIQAGQELEVSIVDLPRWGARVRPADQETDNLIIGNPGEAVVRSPRWPG